MYSSFDEILKEIESIENGTVKTKKDLKIKLDLLRDTLGVLSQRFYYRELINTDRNNITGEDITFIDGVVDKMIGGISIETFFGTTKMIKMREQLNTVMEKITPFYFSKNIKLTFRSNRFLR